MASNIKKYVKHAAVPRLILSYFKLKRRSKVKSILERALGLPGTINFFFAFDCPYSLIALSSLFEILDERSVVLNLFPVINRGIENDPAIDIRRAYSIKDAVRFGERNNIEIKRTTPLLPDQVGFLAALAEAGRGPKYGELVFRFLEQVWFSDDPDISEEPFRAFYENIIGEKAPDDLNKQYKKVRKNEKLLQKKGHWEVPSALVYGEWYFAHERISQIEERLNFLGW